MERKAAEAIRQIEQELERLSSLSSQEISVLLADVVRSSSLDSETESPAQGRERDDESAPCDAADVVEDTDEDEVHGAAPKATDTVRIGRLGLVLVFVAALILVGAATAAPVEAVELASEEAVGHGYKSGESFSWWCCRITLAACIGALTYHLVTMLMKKVAVVMTLHGDGRPSSLPAGSSWKSRGNATTLRVATTETTQAELSHRWGSSRRREVWTIQDIAVVAGGGANDFAGILVCDDHDGATGIVLIHRGGRNDLHLQVAFFDTNIASIEVDLHRV